MQKKMPPGKNQIYIFDRPSYPNRKDPILISNGFVVKSGTLAANCWKCSVLRCASTVAWFLYL